MDEIYEPAEDSFLVELALEDYTGLRALDMGTGSGILARVLANKFKEVTAVDINPKAQERVSGIANCKFVLSDLFAKVKGSFDLIVFNPPYLPEDDGDLRYAGGVKGEVIKRFFEQAKTHLAERGKIVFILSSLSPLKDRDIEALGYSVRKLREKKMSWESLSVYEAKRSS